MKIKIKVTPNANTKSIKVEKDLLTSEDIYLVRITAVPVDGKANKALIEDLAKYFDVRKGQIRIISGETSRMKVVEIDKPE